MRNRLIAALIVLFILGAILYAVFLWEPVSGWLFDNVILSLSFGSQTRNPSFLEGIGLIFLSFALMIFMFIVPYVLLWIVIIIALFAITHKKNF